MSPTIKIQNLGKCYRLGTINRHTLVEEAQYLLCRLRKKDARQQMGKVDQLSPPSSSNELFWALRNISMDVNQGDVVGLIGRNGAGKSTLLKLLTRITEPSEGEAFIRGRVASLLEVGTGFHPELTGRENIFMNGTILGMTTREISSQFDEIIEFAELAQFVDTPVKRYSSGMYVRLAFAVAAHLEPEILLVDEVLAVGDAAFQKKCLEKIRSIASGGRTVFFVSHNMTSIETLCNRAALLEGGRLKMYDDTAEVLKAYTRGTHQSATNDLTERAHFEGSGKIRLTQMTIQDESGSELHVARSGQDLTLQLQLFNHTDTVLNQLRLDVTIEGPNNQRIAYLSSRLVSHDLNPLPPGAGSCRIHLPNLRLNAGQYSLSFWLFVGGERVDTLRQGATLVVENSDFYGEGLTLQEGQGYFLLDYDMQIKADR